MGKEFAWTFPRRRYTKTSPIAYNLSLHREVKWLRLSDGTACPEPPNTAGKWQSCLLNQVCLHSSCPPGNAHICPTQRQISLKILSKEKAA